MRHCRGCSHPTICDSHGCGAEEARANEARKKAAEAEKAELEALRRDGLRYRWLKDRANPEYIGVCRLSYTAGFEEAFAWLYDSDADAAIDAAMALHNAKFSGGR